MTPTRSVRAPSGLRRFARRVLSLFGLVVATTVFTPVTEWLATPLRLAPSAPTEKVDAIVVLEAWASEVGELNESGTARVLLACNWYLSGAAETILVTGSKPRPSRPGSALAAMASLLRRLGVPDHVVQVEGSSRNTHDSAVNVARVARERGWSRVALVTDYSHMRRASMAFHRAGLEVVRAPTLWKQLGAGQPSTRFARVGTLSHEYGGLLYYWWQGWI